MSTTILGISAYYHDSAAALLRDGEIVAAAQEERFSRKKHDAGFPRHAIDLYRRLCAVLVVLRSEQPVVTVHPVTSVRIRDRWPVHIDDVDDSRCL